MSTEREQMREALEIANDVLEDEYKCGSLLRTDVRYSIFKTLYDEIMSEPEPEIDWKARAEKAEAAIRSYFYLRNHDMEEATKGMSRVIAEKTK